jgi:uncharacterized protein YndB with AHSA1/START domain
MRVEETVEIAAPPEKVWEVLADVESWPTWTASTTSVRLLRPGPLGVGAAVEIKQPRLPKVVWTITAYDPGRAFTWEARSPGVHSTGEHAITPTPTGSTVRLAFSQEGPLGTLLSLPLARLIRSYVHTEATGLKTATEP